MPKLLHNEPTQLHRATQLLRCTLNKLPKQTGKIKEEEQGNNLKNTFANEKVQIYALNC